MEGDTQLASGVQSELHNNNNNRKLHNMCPAVENRNNLPLSCQLLTHQNISETEDEQLNTHISFSFSHTLPASILFHLES